MAIVRGKLWLLGERDHPEALVTLPKHVVGDLLDLLARAQGLTPGVSIESVVYTVWRLGSRRLDESLRRRIPVRVRTQAADAKSFARRSERLPGGSLAHSPG